MTTDQKTAPRSLWQRKSVKIVAAVIVCLVCISLFLPFGAKIYLQKWLLENGADSAVIDRVRFNPFSGVAALEGATVGKNGETVFSDSTIYCNVGLTNLFGHEALLQQVTLTDVLLDIESSADGSMRIASYTIMPQEQQAGSKDAAGSDVAEPSQEPSSWIFRADSINIENVSVRYRQPDLRAELVIEEAIIKDINTDPNGKKGSISLKGSVNGAPIELRLPALAIMPGVDLEGHVSLSAFKLDDLAGVLGEYLAPFSGTAAVDGEVEFTMDKDFNLAVAYDGLIHLDQGAVGGEGWGEAKGTIDYKGKASFTMDQEDMAVAVDGDLQALEAAFDMPDPVLDIDNADIKVLGKTTVNIGEEVVVDTSASLRLAATTFAMDILEASTGETTWDGHVLVETGTATKELAVHADGMFNAHDPAYSMDMNGAPMDVNTQELLWDGKVEYIMGIGEESKSFVRTDGTMKGDVTRFSLPDTIQIQQKGLNLVGKTEVAIGNDIGVSYQGDATLDDTTVELGGVSIGDSQLSWSGTLAYELEPAAQSISLHGALEGKEIYTDVAGMHISQQSLLTKADCTLALAESPSVEGTLAVNGETLKIMKGETAMLSLAEFSMTDAKGNDSGGVVVDSLQLKQLDLPSSANVPVAVTVPQISISGAESPDFLTAGIENITVEQPLVLDAGGNTELAALQSITVNNITLAEDMTVTVKEIAGSGGIFFKEKDKDALATLGTLRMDQLRYSLEKGLVCETVELDKVYGNILREKSSKPEKKEEKSSDAEKTVSTFPVAIKQVKVTGKSGFKFIDESLTKTFMTVFAIESFQVDDIDLNRAEHPFSYGLKGAFDKYSLLNVEGKCAPLAKNIIVEQDMSLENFSMLQVSPYTVEAIGTYFPDGTLNYHSRLHLSDNKIDMKNNLIFSDLQAEAVEGKLAKKLDNQLPVPLNLALSMLRDHDGFIDLDIPIEGELSDLDVGLTDIIVTALGKGITVAVTPYLAYTALGPAGALAFIGAEVGMALLHTDLPALEFEAGARKLTEKHEEILKEVGEQMEEETEKTYNICAKVSRNELSSIDNGDKEANQEAEQNEAIHKELFKLGEQRSLLVKEYLLSNFTIDEENLLICNPGLEFDEEEKPTVSFKESKKN